MNVIITMAGAGSRFQNAGVNVPKHKIEVKGKSLFAWSLSSLKNFFHSHFTFVAQRNQASSSFIANECRNLGIEKYSCLELDALTSGQAETAFLAKGTLNSTKEQILIYNIDTYVESNFLHPEQIKGDGWIPVFKAAGDRWSFCKIDSNNKVTEIAEKKRISEFATIGLYYFTSFNLFEECYQQNLNSEYSERYVAPMYETLIRNPQREVFASLIPTEAVHVLGTPEDIAIFSPGNRSLGSFNR